MIRKNRWWLAVVYCLLALLVISVVVSCFVKVSSKPEIQGPDYYSIKIENQAEYTLADKEHNAEKYNKINDAFEGSFKEAFLTSLFSGRLSFESKIENMTSAPTFKGYTLKLGYEASEQTIMFKGKEFNPPTNTAETVKYKVAYIDITEGQGYTTQYLYYEYTYKAGDATKTAYYKQSFLANFDELYKLLAD